MERTKHPQRLLAWLLLPLLTEPAHIWYRGQFISVVRRGVMRFFESWQERIHGEVLDVGAGGWTYPRQLLAGRCRYRTVDVVGGPNVDVICSIYELATKIPPASCDFVLCCEVLEHLAEPQRGVDQLRAVLKPNGTLLLTTPFNFHLHETEQVRDYYRITAQGLRHLLRQFSDVTVLPTGPRAFPYGYCVTARK